VVKKHILSPRESRFARSHTSISTSISVYVCAGLLQLAEGLSSSSRKTITGQLLWSIRCRPLCVVHCGDG
jgi:hypothetical protein